MKRETVSKSVRGTRYVHKVEEQACKGHSSMRVVPRIALRLFAPEYNFLYSGAFYWIRKLVLFLYKKEIRYEQYLQRCDAESCE